MTVYPYTLSISGSSKSASLIDSDANGVTDRLVISWSDESGSYADTYQLGWLDTTHWYAYDGVGSTPLDAPMLVYGAVSGTSGDLSYTASVVSASSNQVVIAGKAEAYNTIAVALDAASDGDIILVGSGHYVEDITITKSVTLLGANHGLTAVVNDADGNPIPDLQDGVRANDETWIDGTVTVKTHDVEINGFRLHNIDGALKFDGTVLADNDATTNLDNLTLVNNYITGYLAGNAPTLGVQGAAGTNATGWTIADNFIGGVITDATYYGSGSLYLSGLADSSISDNAFWRPAAAHLYLSTLTNVTVDGNEFYHGVHASGADFDGYADEFYGDSEGFGYGAYADVDGNGVGDTYFGRNYWFELIGVNDGVYVVGNTGSYNSGGIQLNGEIEGYAFDDIVISGNAFDDFVNADPYGTLTDEESRHLSGLMGAINISVNSGSTASDVLIKDNSVTMGADQVYSAFDVSGLVQVTGHVSDLVVQGNDLNWVASEGIYFDFLASALPATDYFDSAGKVLEGIGLYAGLDGKVSIAGNDISFPTGTSLDLVGAGVYVDKALSSSTYGTYEAETLITSDNVYTEPSPDLPTHIVLDSFGGTVPENLTVACKEGDQPYILLEGATPGSYSWLVDTGSSPYEPQPANEAPLVLNEIEDVVLDAPSHFSFPLYGTFIDLYPADDTLSYTVADLDGSSLPGWLEFDQQSRTITGSPTGTGAYSVEVTVKDYAGVEASESFEITILSDATYDLTVHTDYWTATSSSSWWAEQAPVKDVGFGTAVSDGFGNAVVSYDEPESNREIEPFKQASDTDNDALDIRDALLILKKVTFAATPLSDEQLIAADYNQDGKVNAFDALQLLRHAAGVAAPEPEWVFYDASASELDPESPIVVDMNSDTSASLIGILIGDVDGSWGGLLP